jgi:cysteine-rich repeat protein
VKVDEIHVDDSSMVQTYFSTLTKATVIFLVALLVIPPTPVIAQVINPGLIATTTLTVSICGNELVDNGEDCDVPGETGGYSTTIAGRQCDVNCQFGPYCGDGILQTIYGEECDDGNNNDGDFCSSECTIEPAGSGGGGSSGGGSGSSGGSREEIGGTQVAVSGRSYPSQTVHIILDGSEVGTVRADSLGRFEFATNAPPGTVSMGFWANDSSGTRSITLSTTFDVTQGAITNVNGILVPPTLRINDVTVNPGDTIQISGQALPNAAVDVHFNNSQIVERVTANASGNWQLAFNTSRLGAAAHTVRARYVLGTGRLTTQSSFSSTVQLFVGVDGVATRPSDLNRDGLVNLIDFSILIFWWGTNAGQSNPSADINGNGNVGLEDFSILLFNWTG